MITNNIKKQQEHSFEKMGLIIFIISMFSSGLNYLFQIFCGRLLNTADYGQINALFSTINIVSVFGSALGLSITKHIAESTTDYGGNIKQILKHFVLASIPFIAMATTIVLLLNKVDIYTAIIASIAILTSNIAFVFYSILQGKKKFINVSIFNLIQPVFKFITGIFLLLLGMRYHSVLYTMSIGAILSISYGFIKSKKIINYSSPSNNTEVKKIYKYFVFTFISTICLTIFNNIDILIIKQFFDETTTGMYSSAALFGKIILYIPTAFITMMIPIVAECKTNKESIKTLKKTFICSVGISGIACIGLFLLKKFVIILLMGEKFLLAVDYILPVCAMMLTLVCATVFTNYLIAIGDKWFTTIACIFSVIITILLALLFHTSVSQIIYLLSIVYFTLFIVLLVRTIFTTRKK